MAGILATVILVVSVSAYAAESIPQDGAAPPDLGLGFAASEPGKTTVGVQVARADTGALSFEVPLYMTVAVVDGAGGTADVLCPTTYSIRNLSTATDGSAVPIAVTGMVVQGAAGGTWSLRENATQVQQLALNIGGVQLPDVNAGVTSSVSVDLKAGDSKFYDPAVQKYRGISSDPGGTDLPLSGNVAAGSHVADNVGASAQFRCIYTVSLLDKNGNAIGVFYDGPDKSEAVTPDP